jgi:hypothetical protein
MKLGPATLAGLTVGLAVDVLSNAALYTPFDVTWPFNLTGFWGLVYGSFASVVTFGLALWLLNRRVSRPSRIGRLIAAIALGLFGFAVVWWIVMWHFSPFSLEGAGIYPLAAVSLIGAAALFRSLRRSGAADGTGLQTRWSSDLYR